MLFGRHKTSGEAASRAAANFSSACFFVLVSMHEHIKNSELAG